MKWEYKTLDLGTGGFLGSKVDDSKLESLMNGLGTEEWELVTAFAKGLGMTRGVIAIFKRPKR
jgi:hypothetical protein